MTIWVDADACPGAIREILVRAAERAEVELTFVANRPMRPPRSTRVRVVRVPGGFDVADRFIAERVGPDDLVVTADIPLAAAVVDRGAVALDPRGTLYDAESVHERLAVRDLLQHLRDEGQTLGGPAPLSAADRRTFAAELERWLARG